MAAVKRLLVSRRAVAQAYLVHHGGVLSVIDTGAIGSAPRILGGLRAIGRRPQEVRQIVLTHCHWDHAGDALTLKEATGAPVVAGAEDADIIAGAKPYAWNAGVIGRLLYTSKVDYPKFPVDVRVEERTELEGGLVAVPAPGHTPGHLAVMAPELQAVFAGDVAFNIIGLRPPLASATQDPVENARSMRMIAGLQPRQVFFGHGSPLVEDAAARLDALGRAGVGPPQSGE